MSSNLDMNFNQIINLPPPATVNSPVRLGDLVGSAGIPSNSVGLLAGANIWTGINTFSNTTQSTNTSTGAIVIAGGLGVVKNLNVGGTFSVGTVVGTGITTITINNLGGMFPSAGSDGIVLQNNTAATSGVPIQISPDIRFTGAGWNNSLTASHEVDWIISSVPQNGNPVFGKLALGCQVNGGGYNFIANFYSAPTLQALFIGNNSNNAQIVLSGNGSGTNNGGLITVQNGSGNNVFLLGNKSAAFNTAFDGTPVLYSSPGPSASASSFQIFYSNVNTPSVQIFANSTASTTTTTGTFTVTGGLGVSGAIFAGGLEGTPVGDVTPSTAAFTTLSASSTVSGTGFSTYLASPPAIGATAPSTGKFTTIQATSTGTVGTATAVANTALTIQGAGSTSATNAVVFQNSSTTLIAQIRDDGFFLLGGTTNLVPFTTNINSIGLSSLSFLNVWSQSFTSVPILIANLPGSPVAGQRAVVSNGATSPSFLSTVSATGAVTAPVMYNGSAWVYA